MYLTSGVDYYVVVLEEIDVFCNSGLQIRSPNIKFKLLSYPDLNKVMLMEQSGISKDKINEEIVNKSIVGIIGFESETINLDESPAGVVDQLAYKILENSRKIVTDLETAFNELANSCSMFEQICLVVSNYTNNTYEYTQQLPLDELIKRYALCHMAFPSVVPPIAKEKEVESKVG